MEDKNVKLKAVTNTDDKKVNKLSYEQLEAFANQLAQQNEQLKQTLQKQQENVLLARLDFLIRIAELANKDGKYSFSSDFVQNVYQEIEYAITVPEKKEEENNDKTNECNSNK